MAFWAANQGLLVPPAYPTSPREATSPLGVTSGLRTQVSTVGGLKNDKSEGAVE